MLVSCLSEKGEGRLRCLRSPLRPLLDLVKWVEQKGVSLEARQQVLMNEDQQRRGINVGHKTSAVTAGERKLMKRLSRGCMYATGGEIWCCRTGETIQVVPFSLASTIVKTGLHVFFGVEAMVRVPIVHLRVDLSHHR